MARENIYDNSGNYLGYDETNVFDGKVHVRHYGKNGEYLGKSYEATFGVGGTEHKVVHEDASGRTIAYSEVVRDFWGDYYVKTDPTGYGNERGYSGSGSSSGSYSSSSSSSDSGTGILGGILSLVALVIMGILKLIFKYIVKPLLLYYTLPMCAGMTVLVIPYTVLVGLFPISIIAIPFVIILMLCMFASWPYWIKLFIYKSKNNLSYKDILPYFKKWFFKGPFAYRDLKEFINK